MRPIARLQVDRHEARLPVVGVNDRRRDRAAGGELEGRAREHREPKRIVRIVHVVLRVQPVAMKERRLLDEHRAGPIHQWHLEEAHVRGVASDGHHESIDELAGRYVAVARRDDRHVPPQAGEGERQGSEHVGQTARLRERQRFRSNEQNAPVGSLGCASVQKRSLV